jgi:hypothetical protein
VAHEQAGQLLKAGGQVGGKVPSGPAPSQAALHFGMAPEVIHQLGGGDLAGADQLLAVAQEGANLLFEDGIVGAAQKGLTSYYFPVGIHILIFLSLKGCRNVGFPSLFRTGFPK